MPPPVSNQPQQGYMSIAGIPDNIVSKRISYTNSIFQIQTHSFLSNKLEITQRDSSISSHRQFIQQLLLSTLLNGKLQLICSQEHFFYSQSPLNIARLWVLGVIIIFFSIDRLIWLHWILPMLAQKSSDPNTTPSKTKVASDALWHSSSISGRRSSPIAVSVKMTTRRGAWELLLLSWDLTVFTNCR